MLVYRVERLDGTGPYCKPTGDWHTGGTGYSSVFRGARSIDPDGYTKMTEAGKGVYRFGFTKWVDLLTYMSTWFEHVTLNRCFDNMRYYEMVISVYQIDNPDDIYDDTSYGKQCIFKHANAQLVCRHYPDDEAVLLLTQQEIPSFVRTSNERVSCF